jgi:hypothetical protein
VILPIGRGEEVWTAGPFMVALCAGVWLSGYSVRVRRNYQATLVERAASGC